jgi:hypothetical protein
MNRALSMLALMGALESHHANARTDSTGLGERSVSISAGFGVSWISAPRIVDYIDALELQSALLSRYTSAVHVCASVAWRAGRTWDLELEDAYLTKSYTFPQEIGAEASASYGLQTPMLLANYLFLGDRSVLKLGGGAGYTYGFYQDDYFWGSGYWTSGGLCLKLQCEGHISFDDHFYSYLSGELRKSFMSDLHDAGGALLLNPHTKEPVNLSFFSAGITFGFTYYF